MKNQNYLKKIIIGLIILVIIVGIFFGYTFYKASQDIQSGKVGTSLPNLNPNRTPFQTRTASGTDITIVDNPSSQGEVLNPSSTIDLPVAIPRLVQLWKQPVSGFDFIYKDVEIPPATTTATVTPVVAIGATTTISTTTSTSTTKTNTSTTTKKVVVKAKVPIKTTVTKNILKNQLYAYLWDRSTGNIYENLASTTLVNRLSNFTSTQAQEAYFIDPTTVFIRELSQNNEDIVSSYMNLFKETATSTLFTATKKNLPLYTDLISVLPETRKMFYFLKGTGQAYVANLDLSSTFKVLSTSLTQWIPQYVNKTTLAITTKPSAYFQGYLFFVNSSGTQDNQYILGDKYGFTTLVSPDGTKVLYSEILNNELETSIYNIKTKKTIHLTQSTMSEKCVWTADSSRVYCAIPRELSLAPYPDVWYQGTTSFSDNIWSINPETGKFTVEIALQDQIPQPIDAYNMKISKDNKYFLFQDKYTLTLWKYTF